MREFTLTYIGDNAFWGIDMDGLPPGLTYLGTNYTVQLYSSSVRTVNVSIRWEISPIDF